MEIKVCPMCRCERLEINQQILEVQISPTAFLKQMVTGIHCTFCHSVFLIPLEGIDEHRVESFFCGSMVQ